jgi:hypothetical protein
MDRHGTQASVHDGQAIEQRLLTFAGPPSSTRDGEVITWRGGEYSVYSLVQVAHQPHVLTVL